MSCSNILLPPAAVECRQPVISQDELRQRYGLPNAAFDITLSYQMPKVIRMPFGIIESPAEIWLRWVTPEGCKHERQIY